MRDDRALTGRLVIISGPSGVGKSTICRCLLERYRCDRAVTATTRRPRPGEQEGVDYQFLTGDTFDRGVREGEFLEHAEVHGQHYGTPSKALEEKLRGGGAVLLVIDVQGAQKLMQMRSKARRKSGEDGPSPNSPVGTAVFVFVDPPDMKELKRRLAARGTDDEDSAALRLENAREELEHRDAYDHRVVNEDLGRAVEELGVLLGLEEKPSLGRKERV